MRLKRTPPLLYVAVGLVGGLALKFSFGAQLSPAGRYILETWTIQAGPGTNPTHGAYRMDTDTGDLWAVNGDTNVATKVTGG